MAADRLTLREWLHAVDDATRCGRLSPAAHHALSTLAHGVNRDGLITIGSDLLARTMGVHRRTVDHALSEAIAVGLLERVRRGGNVAGRGGRSVLLSRYRITLPKIDEHG